MSVRFASANRQGLRPGWRAAGRGLIAPALARAANDNGGPVDSAPAAMAAQFDPLLRAALGHFAVHGLASAEAALSAAGDAAARGDRFGQDHWLAIARLFDRRRAARAVCEVAPV